MMVGAGRVDKICFRPSHYDINTHEPNYKSLP